MRDLHVLWQSSIGTPVPFEAGAPGDPTLPAPRVRLSADAHARVLALSVGRLALFAPSGESIVITLPGEPRAWFCAAWVAEQGGVCVCSRTGAIILVRVGTAPLVGEPCECVHVGGDSSELTAAYEAIGDIEGGIAGACWSADGRLCLVTGDSRVLVLACSPGQQHALDTEEVPSAADAWSVVAERDAPGALLLPRTHTLTHTHTGYPHAAPEDGPDGPAAKLVPGDDLRVECCWRPDGAFVAVSAVESSARCRVVRVYTHDLARVAAGRNEDGSACALLHPAISWAGAERGHLLAVGQDQPVRSRVVVAFLESNGLRHREIHLAGCMPGLGTLVHTTSWSADSEVLGVELSRATADASQASIQLWTRDNYHWCLKHSIVDPCVKGWMWHPDKPSTFVCVREVARALSADVTQFGLRYVASGSDARSSDGALAVMLEPGRIGVTLPGLALVPPPASYVSVRVAHELSAGRVVPWLANEVHVCAAQPYEPFDGVRSSTSEPHVALSALGVDSSVFCAVLRCRRPSDRTAPGVRNGTAPAANAAGADRAALRWSIGHADDQGVADVVTSFAVSLKDLTFALSGGGSGQSYRLVTESRLWCLRSSQPAPSTFSFSCIASGGVGAQQTGEAPHMQRPAETLLLHVIVRIIDGGAVVHSASAFAAPEPLVGALVLTSTAATPDMTTVIVHGMSGKCWTLLVPVDACSPTESWRTLCVLPEPCPTLLLHGSRPGTPEVVALSAHQNLYANGRLISPAIASIAIVPQHDLLVAVGVGPSPRLLFLPLESLHAGSATSTSALCDVDAGMSGASGLVGAPADCSRLLERGARLACTLPSKDAVLLQMPRGNFECLVPRVLTLFSVYRCLSQQPCWDFATAVELCRTHRVDMNVLHDFAPRRFASPDALTDGMKQLVQRHRVGARTSAGSDRIDQLLSSLDASDVSAGKYAAATALWRARYPATAFDDATAVAVSVPTEAATFDHQLVSLMASPSKINRVCAHVRAACWRVAESSSDGAVNWRHPLIMSVITSFARQIPAALDDVLRVVQRVAGSRPAVRGSDRDSLGQVSTESVLNHAIMVSDADVELLYSTALGMYDISLAHTLAQRSQQDPKEYLPLLAALARLAPVGASDTSSDAQLRQRIAIDAYLSRWSRLAVNIAALAAVREFALPGVLMSSRAAVESAIAVAARARVPTEWRAVLDAAVADPVSLLCTLAVEHHVESAALEAVPASPSTASLRRTLLLSRTWTTVARGVLSDAPRNGVPLIATDILVSAFAPPFISSERIAAAPRDVLLASVRSFLALQPAALDEALTCLLVYACDAGPNADAHEDDTPTWMWAMQLAAHPASCIRRKRFPELTARSLRTALGVEDDVDVRPPSVRDVATCMCTAMRERGSKTARSGAAALLCGALADPEEGVTQWCAAGEWGAAVNAAIAAQRMDLIDTIIQPGLQRACQDAASEIGVRVAALPDACTKLAECRRLRAAAPLEDLVGVPGLDGAVAGGDADALSVWSDATSIVSGGSSFVSGASNSSGRSGASRTSGRFSHRPQTHLPAHLGNVRTSLRFQDGDLTGAEHAARQQQLSHAAADRMDRRHTTTRVKRKESRRRARPGSHAEESALERDLLELLPVSGSSWVPETRALARAALEHGCGAQVDALQQAWTALCNAMRSCVTAVPPRRNWRAEARELGRPDMAEVSIPLPEQPDPVQLAETFRMAPLV